MCLPPLWSVVQAMDPMWESWLFLTNGQQFTVQNFDQLYVLASSPHKTIFRDMTYTVLQATLKPKQIKQIDVYTLNISD